MPVTVDHPGEDDSLFVGVTSVIASLGAKTEGLVAWASWASADFALDNIEELRQIAEVDRKTARRLIANARYSTPTDGISATDAGTQFHRFAELVLAGESVETAKARSSETAGPVHEMVLPLCDSFMGWMKNHTIEVLESELPVFSLEHGYAGTADLYAAVDGVPSIVDFKTSLKPEIKFYVEEHALQLSAYRYADAAMADGFTARATRIKDSRVYLLNREEERMLRPVPRVEAGAIIKVTPRKTVARWVRCDEPVHERFLYLLEMRRWIDLHAAPCLGDPL